MKQSLEFAQNDVEKGNKKHPLSGTSAGRNNFLLKGGQSEWLAWFQPDKNTGSQIASLHNYSEQKSISERTTLQTLRQMSYNY